MIAGVRGSSDSVRVALERDAALSDYESVQLEAGIAALELLGLIGRDSSAGLAIREPSAALDRAPTEADSLRLAAGIERQPEIALARASEAQGRLDLMDAQRRNATTVAFSVDAGLAGANLTEAVPAIACAATWAHPRGSRSVCPCSTGPPGPPGWRAKARGTPPARAAPPRRWRSGARP